MKTRIVMGIGTRRPDLGTGLGMDKHVDKHEDRLRQQEPASAQSPEQAKMEEYV